MGKYGIGARVRHIDGEEGTVTGKAKGLRLVRFDGDEEGVWVKKQYLTAIAEPEPEWQPKVGDRVRSACSGREATIRQVNADRSFALTWSNGETSAWLWSADRFEPITETEPLTIVAGRYYRTRDGRKVLAHDNGDDTTFPFYHDMGLNGYHGVTSNGTSCIGCDQDDLVAEWPSDEVMVAPAAATHAFKVGDRVRVKPGNGTVLLKEGGLYTIERVEDGVVWVQLGIVYGTDFGLISYEPDRFDLVTPVTPDITTGSLVTLATPAIVTGIDRIHAHLQLASGGAYTLPVVALVPAA